MSYCWKSSLNFTPPKKIFFLFCFFSSYVVGGSYRNWKKRYFILRKSTLTYYGTEGDKKPKGVIDLASGRGVRKKVHCLLLEEDWPNEATEDLAFGLAVTGRTYYMYGCDGAAVE